MHSCWCEVHVAAYQLPRVLAQVVSRVLYYLERHLGPSCVVSTKMKSNTRHTTPNLHTIPQHECINNVRINRHDDSAYITTSKTTMWKKNKSRMITRLLDDDMTTTWQTETCQCTDEMLSNGVHRQHLTAKESRKPDTHWNATPTSLHALATWNRHKPTSCTTCVCSMLASMKWAQQMPKCPYI